MSVAELYGPVVLGTDVEEAVKATVDRWLSTYLRVMEQRPDSGYDDDTLLDFRSWETWPDDPPERWPEDQLPGVAVASPGMANEPYMDGGGNYTATWIVDIGVMVSANSRANADKLLKVYLGALRLLLLQHSSLDGFAYGLDWGGENYGEPELPRNARSHAGGIARFQVTVENVVNAEIGPAEEEPPVDEDWPVTAESVTATVVTPLEE